MPFSNLKQFVKIQTFLFRSNILTFYMETSLLLVYATNHFRQLSPPKSRPLNYGTQEQKLPFRRRKVSCKKYFLVLINEESKKQTF